MRCTSHSKLRYISHLFSQCDVRRIGLWGVVAPHPGPASHNPTPPYPQTHPRTPPGGGREHPEQKWPLYSTSSSSESSDTKSFATIELESRDELNPVAKEESRGDEEVFEAFEMNFIGRPVPFREANRQVDLFSPLFE